MAKSLELDDFGVYLVTWESTSLST